LKLGGLFIVGLGCRSRDTIRDTAPSDAIINRHEIFVLGRNRNFADDCPSPRIFPK
jgi:hypothetical protein